MIPMKPTKLGIYLLCLIGVASTMTGTARAGSETGAVIVVGKAQARERAVAASAVRSSARSIGWVLVETPIADAEITKITACLKGQRPWDCLAPLPGTKGLQRLIVMSVDPDRSPDGQAALSLTEQVIVEGAKATTADTRFCPQCADETLTRIAFDLTKRLIEEAATGTARTNITIESAPPGAWITLDNVNVGLTNRKYATFPGRHVVLLQHQGYESETRIVDAVENQDTRILVPLRKKGGAGAGDDERGRRYLVPGFVGGAGLVAFGVGLALQLGKDPPPLGEDQPKRLYSAPGIALMIGGAAAAGLGGYLAFRAFRAPRQPPRSAPTAMVTSGGALVGWTGQF
jgi:hypothetical protein